MAIVLIPVLVGVASLVMGNLPYGWEAYTWAHFAGDPQKPEDGVGLLAGYGSGRWSRTRMTSAQVWLARGDQSTLVSVDVSAMRYSSGTSKFDPARAEPLTRESLLATLAVAGFDHNASSTTVLADTNVAHVRDLRDGRLPPDLTGPPQRGVAVGRVHAMSGWRLGEVSPGAHLLFVAWYLPWCIPFWVALTWLAARPIMRRYRRRLALFEPGGGWRGNDPELRASV
jgi:hypothetical protein